MIAIIDYGVGNLYSLKCSFGAIGAEVVVTGDKNEIKRAERLILPGVGAFRDAIGKLRESGLSETILREAAQGKPLLGICLGMQLLFEKSFEYGEYEGLGLLPGSVRPLSDITGGRLKIPHMGWNSLKFTKAGKAHQLFRYIDDGDHVYFIHSYYGDCRKEDITAVTEYESDITASVAKNNVMGCQFHPEKSGDKGLSILRAFCEMR